VSEINEHEALLRQLMAEADRRMARDLNEAERIYRQVREDAGRVELAELATQADQSLLLIGIRRAWDAGNIQQAQKLYAMLAAQRPGNPQILRRLAKVAAELGKRAQADGWLDDAGRYYFEALRWQPDYPAPREHLADLAEQCYGLGEQALQKDEPLAAQDYFRDTLRWNSQHSGAHAQLAVLQESDRTERNKRPSALPVNEKPPARSSKVIWLGLLIVVVLLTAVVGLLLSCLRNPEGICRRLPSPLVALVASPTRLPSPTSTWAPSPPPTVTFTPISTPTMTATPTSTLTPTPEMVVPACDLLVNGANSTNVVVKQVYFNVAQGEVSWASVLWQGLQPITGGCDIADLITRRYRLVFDGMLNSTMAPISSDLRLRQEADGSLSLNAPFGISALQSYSSGTASFILQSLADNGQWVQVSPLQLQLRWTIDVLTPTVIPTNTPTRLPTPTQQPVSTPSPTPAVMPVSQLLEPDTGASASNAVTFRWSAAQPLAANQFYEIVMWPEGSNPAGALGIAAPVKETALLVHLESVSSVTGGMYQWAVLVVTQNPYVRLTQPAGSAARRLVVTRDIYGGPPPPSPLP